MRRTFKLLTLALSAAGLGAQAIAADKPDTPPDDLGALQLADKAATTAPDQSQRWRIHAEGALGRVWLRNTIGSAAGSFDTSRASLDMRFDDRLAPNVRAVLSDRLDLVHFNGADHTNTLREAYLSFAIGPERSVDLGRINLRHGAALGYNPTDWFREGSARWVSSPDPMQLRENRQGTFVLRGQQLWGNGAVTASYSPKLGTSPSDSTFSLDAGSTNPRHRWLLAGSFKLGERFTPEVLLHGGVDTPTQVGFNASTVLGSATVLFGEFSVGRGRTLLDQALGRQDGQHSLRRAAFGLTYTTSFNLSLTAEVEYNGAGATVGQWQSLPQVDLAAQLRLLGLAQSQQELPARRAVFLYASWKDAGLRHFDLSAFVRRDGETSSRAQWLEARYRWLNFDVSLQMQWFSGDTGSMFGSVPQRRAVELALRGYL